MTIFYQNICKKKLILYFVADSKVNDFHSEADSNDGRSSGKNHIFMFYYIIIYHKSKNQSTQKCIKGNFSFVGFIRQIIFLNLVVCNFHGPNDCYLFDSLVPKAMSY